MPELPEVETICRGLASELEGRTLISVEIFRPDLRVPFPDNFCSRLEGQTVTHISRRSKYLLIHCKSGLIWVIHLGMSGQVLLESSPPEKTLGKHDHVLVQFDNGMCLRYRDPRRFGLMTLTTETELPTHHLFAHLGPEPLESAFTGKTLYQAIHARKTTIKQAIMDAKNVVGVGNIYACESLFRAGIRPTRQACKVSKKACAQLAKAIKNVLHEAITSGGSTLRDYVRSSGDLGYFQHHFAVYGREGKPCTVCKTPIKRIIQQNRSSFFCPKCQK